MASQSSSQKKSKAYKEDKKQPFLEAFARIGTIAGAAESIGIHRDSVYSWKKDDAEFAQAFEKADISLTETIEGVMHEKALKGDTTACIFLLKARKPHKYTERYKHEVESQQVGKLIGLMTSVLKRCVPQQLWPIIAGELDAAANSLEAGQGQHLLQ